MRMVVAELHCTEIIIITAIIITTDERCRALDMAKVYVYKMDWSPEQLTQNTRDVSPPPMKYTCKNIG